MGFGVLRNEPCSCGSGLKQKRCCGHPQNGREANLWMLGLHAPQPTVRPLTGSACVGAVAKVRQGLARLGVEPSSRGETDLDVMLRKLETVGNRHPGSLWEADLSAEERRHVRYIEQVARFETLLEALRSPRISGQVNQYLPWFRRRLDTLGTLGAEAQDRLLELEMGAAFATAGMDVSFDEPDLVLSGVRGLPTMALPVKRPRTLQGVEAGVRRGTKQARARGLPAAILVSLDAVVATGMDGKPLELWSRTLVGLREGSWRRFKETVVEAEQVIRHRTDPIVMGVVWLARMPGAVRPAEMELERPSYSRPTFAIGSLNREHWDGKEGPLIRLLTALYRGLP